ncbi:DUF222 domain-containing protein [Rhodococcus zopfii]|uniref:DUF222 domain-containing protein n=1 Tax=Rhodococcus zopfii TaxID=43772 RepID=UPI001F0DB806|nr:DUF222 domain-containing protein [Rhodococcus zopfii]
MLSIRVGGDTIEARLTALDTAVDGLLGDDLSGLSNDDIVEVLQRMETALRTVTAVGHRIIVESTERMIPGHLGCRSTGDFLIGTLRISAADGARRVTGAKKAGTWHGSDGGNMAEELPATAAAQRAGAIGPDHVAAVARVMRKVPYGAGLGESTVAEKILADAARSVTPEGVAKLGAHLLAHLDPDGTSPMRRNADAAAVCGSGNKAPTS